MAIVGVCSFTFTGTAIILISLLNTGSWGFQGLELHGPETSSLPLGKACAGVIIIYLLVLLASFDHAPSLTSPQSPIEEEAITSHRFARSGLAPLSQEVACNASAPPVTQKHWLPATRLPRSYSGWTFTN